jgi:formylmethanofuran dehydrogenase subunit E
MKAVNTVDAYAHPVRVAMPQSAVRCSWCGEPVVRKPLSGARMSHTICRACTQQFHAETDGTSDRRES